MNGCPECGAYVEEDGELCEDCEEVWGGDDDGGYDYAGSNYAAEERAEDRRRFGAECKVMMGLLATHKLPSTFEDAKRWVREFGDPDYENATELAAEWLDEGWRHVGDRHETTPLHDARAVFLDAEAATASLKLGGLTPKMVEDAYASSNGRKPVMRVLAEAGHVSPDWAEADFIDFLEHLRQQSAK